MLAAAPALPSAGLCWLCKVKIKLLLLDGTGDQKAGSVKALSITELTFTDSGLEGFLTSSHNHMHTP